MIDYTHYHHPEQSSVLVVQVAGRLDSTTADFLLDCLQGFIERGESRIVVDCMGLQSITSIGLATLVRANSRLKSSGGEMNIANASGVVAETLKIVHFDRLFHMFPSVDDAAGDLVS